MHTTTLKFTIETQTENNEVISLCHLNEKTIALELSDIARKMFKLNRSLFDKINSSTTVSNGIIYRHQVKLPKQTKNKLGVNLLNKYDYDEVQIISIPFTKNFMPKRQSILTKNGRRIDFNPLDLDEEPEIENMGKPLDPQNLTIHDVKNSTMICEIEEINLFQDSGVKTYLIKDFMGDSPNLYQVAYRIEIKAETEFKNYLKFIIKELQKSIDFLTSYNNSMLNSLNYDAKLLKFKKSFKDSIFNQLGIPNDIEFVKINSEQIKNSEFGKCALNYYNASLLLSPNVQKSIYGKIIKGLLPTSQTSPQNILGIINSFSVLLETIRREYNIDNKDSKSSDIKQNISSNKISLKNFVVATTEKLNIEREPLGYNIFSESQTGLNKFTTDSYRKRIGAEESKYYPSTDISDNTNFMTNTEKSSFANRSNAPSFITPANLVLGKKRITCSRGMSNISVDDIREFRVAKSARAVQASRTNYPSGLSNASLSKNVMADFNITIGNPVDAILERSTDIEIDPLQDVKHYVGESSYFTTNNPEFIYKNFKNLINRQDKRIFAIVSDVIPGRFLRQNGSIESIKDLQLSNKNSKFRSLVSKKRINFEEIPPQIKSMMTDSFQNNSNIDPLKNRESRAIIDETQKNVFLIRAHTGFELDEDGFPNLNKPIIEDMDKVQIGSKPVIAKAYNYEVPELGIVKDKFMPTIYNNLVYVRD